MSESPKTLPIPSCAADVAPWCERMQSERLNDSGREAIGLAAMALLAMFEAVEEAKQAKADLRAARDALDPGDVKARARLTLAIAQLPGPVDITNKTLPQIEKQIRVGLQCDKGEADRSLVSLREYAARQEALAQDFGPSRDDDPEAGPAIELEKIDPDAPSSPEDAPEASTPPEGPTELVGELREHVARAPSTRKRIKGRKGIKGINKITARERAKRGRE